jgi:hypothetical protein
LFCLTKVQRCDHTPELDEQLIYREHDVWNDEYEAERTLMGVGEFKLVTPIFAGLP